LRFARANVAQRIRDGEMAIRRENTTSITARIEMPIARRESECCWKLPNTNRICVSAHCAHEMAILARILVETSSHDRPFVMETEEMWTSKKKVMSLTGLSVLDLSDPSQDYRYIPHHELNDREIIYSGGGCYVFIGDNEFARTLAINLEAKEWYGYELPSSTFVPYGLRQEAMQFPASFDQYVLEHVDGVDPLFFLSPNHLHLEIMTRDTLRIPRVLQELGVSIDVCPR
jgi:hypothetical protein